MQGLSRQTGKYKNVDWSSDSHHLHEILKCKEPQEQRVGGGETIIRIYCVKENLFSIKIKLKKNMTILSCFLFIVPATNPILYTIWMNPLI